MKHDEGVQFAAKWLARQCQVIATEIATGDGETPDAIGWAGITGGYMTIVIEVKVSHADFKADAKKYFRSEMFSGRAMGVKRYYLAPEGIITPDELPSGWGLLVVTPRGRIREDVIAIRHQERNVEAETGILISLLRRIGQNTPKGVSIKVFEYETKNRATLYLKKTFEAAEKKPAPQMPSLHDYDPAKLQSIFGKKPEEEKEARG